MRTPTVEQAKRFNAAKKWMDDNDGHETRQDRSDGFVVLVAAHGAGAQEIAETEDDYAEAFVGAVEALRQKLGA